ncbi:3-phosphoshikimate 1-carboxyvinyltransferase [Bacillus andreraoultii]|uniref:3-phosphoshikimate 1-carboxyvinyltransferase n=1 Tax=Bacillus andreraoultii TaxID=1499685 RepID=UPI000539D0C3|nr:3-phosphoshikimate 1-carboxyvinyltransferase [Bacillus andreraoultii]
MGNLNVLPKKLTGSVKVPPSKSMAHRAVICAALSNGVSKITNIDFSDDMIATIQAMESFGAKITKQTDELEVIGIFHETAGKENQGENTIDCNESGSTLRFVIPISTLFPGPHRFIGRGKLGERPLDTYYKIFEQQGVAYQYREGELNLVVDGKLQSGLYEVEGNVSSQFITGLLFTLPLLDGDSTIVITTELESKGYIDLTLSAMKDFGIEVVNNDYKEFFIKGKQKYKARDYRVEADYSQAAFFLVANALKNEVVMHDLNLDSLQGDKEAIEILERMGMGLREKDGGFVGEADDRLIATTIDGSQCPDIIPVISLAAALSDGTTEIINAGRLRIKESDRLHATTTELNKLGANITELEDGLVIEGVSQLNGGVEVWSHKDHRIAMMLAIASTVCNEPIIIKDYEAVSKSYPNFWQHFKQLGGHFVEWNMGE